MPAPSITVYSMPDCVQCDAVKRALNKAGVAYDAVDITQNTDALAKVKALGYAQAPVIVWVDRRGMFIIAPVSSPISSSLQSSI